MGRTYLFREEGTPDNCPMTEACLNPAGLRDTRDEAPCQGCEHATLMGNGRALRFTGQDVYVECSFTTDEAEAQPPEPTPDAAPVVPSEPETAAAPQRSLDEVLAEEVPQLTSGDLKPLYEKLIGLGFELTRSDLLDKVNDLHAVAYAQSQGIRKLRCSRCGIVEKCPYEDAPAVDRVCLATPQ